MKLFYELGYRYFKMPWDIGPRKELVELVESGRLRPGRAIDLGSGTASNAIFLAQNGFEVTGIDFAPAAIEKGGKMAKEAGVDVEFNVDDLTDLRTVKGPFDLLVDYGTLDDLNSSDRALYIRNVIPLTQPGSFFLLYVFEWELSWWERFVPIGQAFEPGEVQVIFGKYFEIEMIASEQRSSGFPRGYAVYLMTRKSN